jgi:hypothetical protein
MAVSHIGLGLVYGLALLAHQFAVHHPTETKLSS